MIPKMHSAFFILDSQSKTLSLLRGRTRKLSSSSSSTSSNDIVDNMRNVDTWKHKVAKRLHNTGKAYKSTRKKSKYLQKKVPTCGEKKRLK